jgi:hypothetical protein
MYADPNGIQGIEQDVIFFAVHQTGCVPTGAPVNHVEDDVVIDEH